MGDNETVAGLPVEQVTLALSWLKEGAIYTGRGIAATALAGVHWGSLLAVGFSIGMGIIVVLQLGAAQGVNIALKKAGMFHP